MTNSSEFSTDQLVSNIVEGIENIKGEDITLMDLRELENTVCKYFIICSAKSNTQAKALSSNIQKEVSKNLQEKPWHVEGESNAQWILIDYVDVVVHIFLGEARAYYDIEGLWGDAQITELSNPN